MRKKHNFLKFFALIVPMSLCSCSLFGSKTDDNEPKQEESTTDNTTPEETRVQKLQRLMSEAVAASNYTMYESIPQIVSGDNVTHSNTYYVDHNTVGKGSDYIYSFFELTVEYHYDKYDDVWTKKVVDNVENPLPRFNALLSSFKSFEQIPNDAAMELYDNDNERWVATFETSKSDDFNLYKYYSVDDVYAGTLHYRVSNIGKTKVTKPENAEWYVKKTAADIWEETRTSILETQSFKYHYFNFPNSDEPIFVDHNNTKIGNIIYTTENDKTYKFEQNDNVWVRSEIDEPNPSEAIYKWLNGLLLDGTTKYMDGSTYLVGFDRVNKLDCYTDVNISPTIFFALYLHENGMYDIERQIEDIGEVTVTLPESFVEAD